MTEAVGGRRTLPRSAPEAPEGGHRFRLLHDPAGAVEIHERPDDAAAALIVASGRRRGTPDRDVPRLIALRGVRHRWRRRASCR